MMRRKENKMEIMKMVKRNKNKKITISTRKSIISRDSRQ